MESVSIVLVYQTQDTKLNFTWHITCEVHISYIFFVVHHLEVEHTFQNCIL
jgi:hypothetical protein